MKTPEYGVYLYNIKHLTTMKFAKILILLIISLSSPTGNIDGIDVSHHQGEINWSDVKKYLKADAFVYIKCTEGATLVDKKCKIYARNAKEQGILIGGYHYFRMTSTPEDQFKNFKKALDEIGPDLIPMVDVETSDKKPTKELQRALQKFLNMLEKEYGKKPMIYGTARSYNSYCATKFDEYPAYIGRYGVKRPVLNGKTRYLIWQYSEAGAISGIEKKVDLCRFRPGASIEDIKL